MGLRDKKRPRERTATPHSSSTGVPGSLASMSNQFARVTVHMEQLERKHDRIITYLRQAFPNFPQELQGEISGLPPFLRVPVPVSFASVSEQFNVIETRMERLERKLAPIFTFIRENNFDLPQEILD